MNENMAVGKSGGFQSSAGVHSAPLRIAEVYHPSVGDIIAGWTVLGELNVVSSEADLCLCRHKGVKAILKLYRHGISCPLADSGRLKSLHHPGLIPTLACGVHRGRSFEVTAQCRGSLQDVLASGGRLTPEATRNLLAHVASAIAFLHEQGIQHRDIKPSNLLVAPDPAGGKPSPPTYWLSDFGRSEETTLTRLTMSLSTVAYAAPESVNGIYSQASDYWSLGMVLLECLLGKHPLEDRDGKSIQFAIVSGNIPIPEDLSDEWKRLLRGLLVTDHTRRWGYAEIAEWLAQSERPVVVARPRSRAQWMAFAAISLVLAGVGLLFAEEFIAIIGESALGAVILTAVVGLGVIAARLGRRIARTHKAGRSKQQL